MFNVFKILIGSVVYVVVSGCIQACLQGLGCVIAVFLINVVVVVVIVVVFYCCSFAVIVFVVVVLVLIVKIVLIVVFVFMLVSCCCGFCFSYWYHN